MRAALGSGTTSRAAAGRDAPRAHCRGGPRSAGVHRSVPRHGDAERSARRRGALGGQRAGPLHGIPVTLQEGFDFEGRPTTFGTGHAAHRALHASALVRALSDGRRSGSRSHQLGTAPAHVGERQPAVRTHAKGSAHATARAGRAEAKRPLWRPGSRRSVSAPTCSEPGVYWHFCGAAQLKPTRPACRRRRWSRNGTPRSECRAPSRKVSDIGLALDALPARRLSLLDPRMPPLDDLPARSLVGLSVGVFSEGPLLAPSSALVGAIERAGDALRRAGAKLTPYTPPGLDELFFDCMSLLAADGGAAWLEALEGSPVAEALRPLTRLLKVPGALRGGMERVTRLAGDADGARFVSCFAEKSAREYQELVARLEARHVELCRALEAAEIDALLCPPFATPAVPHGQSGEFWLASGYSVPFSAMGWPFAVVPVTRVHGAEARRDRARGRLGRLARRIDEESAGLPVGVELVAPPWRDRTLVAMAQAIEHNVSGDVDFPRTPLW
ncbi:MAG: amidase family protein [Polyangiaceae bacterium]